MNCDRNTEAEKLTDHQGQLQRMSKEAKIDLSQYKTSELASTVPEIMAVPASIRVVIFTTLFSVLLLVTRNTVLYAFGEPGWTPLILSSIYSLVAATALGFALGLIRVAGLLVARIERVLQLILGLSETATVDYNSLRSGDARFPSSTEIVEHVYNAVVLPAMESAVAKSFGVLGIPLLWIYRRTVGGAVRYLIARMKSSTLTEEEKQSIQAGTSKFLAEIAENQEAIESNLRKAMSYTKYVGDAVRKLLLRPMQIAFAVVTLVAVLPLGLFWFWVQ